ncbi:MAG: hypothetical protein PF503_19850 [Desulfobacula sp.]|nr:hypothetical protein [Desulfobacula sp.]
MAINKGYFGQNGVVPKGYGRNLDERVIEYPWIYSRLSNKVNSILDAGSSLNYEYLLSLPHIAEADVTICTQAPEKRCYWKRSVSYVFDDLRGMKFGSAVFDTVISISTIEHIGLDNTMLYTENKTKCEQDTSGYILAVQEFHRVSKKGGDCFISVPFGRAENHGWFQVFDEPMIQKVVKAFNPVKYEIEYFGYLKEGWHRSSPDSLRDAIVFDVQKKKTFDEDKAASARGVACLHLVA